MRPEIEAKFHLIAAAASICALGLSLYELLVRGGYIPAGVCGGVFLLATAVFFKTRSRQKTGRESYRQIQCSGANAMNIQAGGNINIGVNDSTPPPK